MKIAILGYGKMGKTVERLAGERGHTIILKTKSDSNQINLAETDVAIEFSTPDAALQNITLCLEQGIPIVSGTTGWLTHYNEIINLCVSRNGSFIYASNFSIGVNLFFNINEYVAKLMLPWTKYNVSIEEIHHIQKKDSPSGTAISLAESIIKHSEYEGWKLDEKTENNIQISSKRIKDEKGIHCVSYVSDNDTISIKHKAHSRDGFGLGAILAAEWLQNKKGVFTMKDVLKINNI